MKQAQLEERAQRLAWVSSECLPGCRFYKLSHKLQCSTILMVKHNLFFFNPESSSNLPCPTLFPLPLILLLLTLSRDVFSLSTDNKVVLDTAPYSFDWVFYLEEFKSGMLAIVYGSMRRDWSRWGILRHYCTSQKVKYSPK